MSSEDLCRLQPHLYLHHINNISVPLSTATREPRSSPQAATRVPPEGETPTTLLRERKHQNLDQCKLHISIFIS